MINIENNNFTSWFKDLKIAVISKNINSLREIVDYDLSKMNTTLDTKKELLFYLGRAIDILQKDNENLSQEMIKVQQQNRLNKSLMMPYNQTSKYI